MTIKKVLLVEDKAETVPFAEEAFRNVFSSEYELAFAADYKHAEEALAKESFAGIVTDCFFPYDVESDDSSEGKKIYFEMRRALEDLVEASTEGMSGVSHPVYDASVAIYLNLRNPAHQPLGVRVYEKACRDGIPVVMATAHHAGSENDAPPFIVAYLERTIGKTRVGDNTRIRDFREGATDADAVDVCVLYKNADMPEWVLENWTYAMSALKRKIEDKRKGEQDG